MSKFCITAPAAFRFQAIAKGSAVPGANILIEDGVGNDLYSLETLDDGRTPWIALPSNSHLDFRGLQGGDNPDGLSLIHI